ncbi:hypothetical protein ACQKII_11640 [Lysinibacillus sp. NPDC048646]|uniref:hypothetical protein n=1 Tax=Lysinibacillus sp. NPDC048646 TaxID=3390574 RepID=UPI003D0288EA
MKKLYLIITIIVDRVTAIFFYYQVFSVLTASCKMKRKCTTSSKLNALRAFIVGDLQSREDSIESLNHLRLRNADGLKVKIIIPQVYKKSIEQALNIEGINESTIYPEIERVSSYLKYLY